MSDKETTSHFWRLTIKTVGRNKIRVFIALASAVFLTLIFQNCSGYNANGNDPISQLSTPMPSPSPLPIGPLEPQFSTIASTSTLQFNQFNDTGGGAFQLVAGQGSVDPTTGLFTPASNYTDAIVGRPDVNGNWTYSYVKVASPGAALTLEPVAALVAPSSQVSFGGAGGTPPYTYSVSSGAGAMIDANTGLLTAGVNAETVTVTVKDSAGATATANLQVQLGATAMSALLAASPMIAGQPSQFVVVGGVYPYTLTLKSGTGTINALAYTPPVAPENNSFQIADANGQVLNVSSSSIYDPLHPVVAGTTSFSTTGTFSYTVPNFNSLQVVVKGAGGGGGGRDYARGWNGHPGSAGNATSFGSVIAYGGTGGAGGAWVGHCGANGSPGTSSGGTTNSTGGGNLGGGSGTNGLGDCGGTGGAGGMATITYTPATLPPGSVITITVGAGGTGGADGIGTRTSGNGAAGSVSITVQ